MKASTMLFLLGYLMVPSGARILGRCTVADMLYRGGLDYFEGYKLENWVCLAYYESKFNPSAVYENEITGHSGFGLFQIREDLWCGHGKNLCGVSCSELLNPDLKKTIELADLYMLNWTRNCQFSDTLSRWLDGCRL
uniref:Lysozyme like 4 n=1 Tax=Spermophilus dauricus TaxID=99837 RepID=A0A8C9P8C4_SPEDA